jgi:hypothetical protein
MATVSGGQAGAVAGGASAFSQFRLTTFVDGNPKASRKNNPSPSPRITAAEANIDRPSQSGGNEPNATPLSHLGATSDASDTAAMSQTAVRPSSGGSGAQTTQASTGSGVGAGSGSASATHNGFSVLDLAPAPSREGKLGPHRDGRVRNPVPLKLKGKTDEKKGNFAVMHMDMSGSAGANDIPRSEAAQRTSESTAQAARAASREGYTPVKRRRVEVPKPAPVPQPAAGSPSFPMAMPPPAPAVPRVHRTRPLTSEEIKKEQARLLTLLRSIHPVNVVDAICSALAFFGGIPGAPPPADGMFPESADANGSGGIFVSWLSEIFPDITRINWPGPEVVRVRSQEGVRASRPRGRPKGSKASKVRKDKGIKKGPKHKEDRLRSTSSDYAHLQPNATGPDADDEWVDITNVDLQVEEMPSRSKHSVFHNRTSSSTARPDYTLSADQTSPGLNASAVSQNAAAAGRLSHANSRGQEAGTADPAKRRPGRPKGSRNRPKTSDLEQQLQEASASTISGSLALPSVSNPVHTMPHGARQSLSSTSKRRGAHTSGQPQADKDMLPLLSAEEQALVEDFRAKQAAQATNTQPANPKKRGRPPKNPVPPPSDSLSPAITTSTTLGVQGSPVTDSNSNILVAQAHQPALKDSGPILPPAKRQRKAKEPTVAANKKIPSSSDSPGVTSASSAVAKSTTIPTDPVAPLPTTSLKPPAQGLEAHYERFTASLSQGEQQQKLHQPQQAQPQPQIQQLHRSPLQQPQLHQPQQSHTRHDINAVTRSSPLQSSNTYYQPRHIPPAYADQQFPPHTTTHSYQPSLMSQADSFRATNTQHSNFSPRQQQQQPTTSHYNHFNDSSFMDIPALDSVANGASGVPAYGQSLSRSASSASFGSASQLRTAYEEDLIREQLIRGMGTGIGRR